MAGFRRAKPQQAALKIGMYGTSGSGKTFTALLFAEGLAKITGKKIAFVDTETGTAFYCQNVSNRSVHPEAFQFDVLHTRSISEVLSAVCNLSEDEYSVIVIDSITHIWEAAKEAYSGKLTKAGQPPFHAWAKIKKPFKDLISIMMSSKLHMIICGREGNIYEEDPDSGELKQVGNKMKAEGETPYEPHILLRMGQLRNPKEPIAKIAAFVEKDRTGVLSGNTFIYPTFDTMISPLLDLLGDKQANIKTLEETAGVDAEAFAVAEKEKEQQSTKFLQLYAAKMDLAENAKELWSIGEELTPDIKREITTAHIALLKEKFFERQAVVGKYEKPKVKKQSKKQSASNNAKVELSQTHQKVKKAAEAVFGDDGINEITRIAKNCQEPFAFSLATPQQLQYLLEEINARADS